MTKIIQDLKWLFKILEEPCKHCGEFIPLKWWQKLWAAPFWGFVLWKGISKEEIFNTIKEQQHHNI